MEKELQPTDALATQERIFVTFAVILAVTVLTIAVLAVLDKHSRNATDDAHILEKIYLAQHAAVCRT